MVDILMVGYGDPAMEARAIQSLIECTQDFTLHYVENRARNEKCTARLWNEFIGQSRSKVIAIVDNDVIFTPGWLDPLVLVALREDAGLVGPASDGAGDPRQNTRGDDIVDMGDALSGFCFVAKASVFLPAGFDESYMFYGQEAVMCRNLMTWGKKNYCVRSSFVHHLGSASVKWAKDHGDAYDFEGDMRGAMDRLRNTA